MESPVIPILTLLMFAVLVAVASRQLRVPYNIALVVAGMVLSRFDWSAYFPAQTFQLNPVIIFNVFLPALLFQASLETSISEFRANIAPIAGLAIVGTFGAVICIGAVLSVTVFAGFENGLLLGLLMGAILASTDTVSVLNAFKSVRVPNRLGSIVEGESLFNDGAALVAFALILSLLQGGEAGAGLIVSETAKVVVGGAGLGAVIGFLGGKLCRALPDGLTALMLTTVVAYGSYIAGEALQVSGVIATVSAGLTFRGTAWSQDLAPGTRLTLLSFWEFAGFLVNSFVFLLLGFQINFGDLTAAALPILWGLLAIHLARVLTVYPLMGAGRVFGHPVPLRWQHVMVFGNIKGAVSAAMALLVPLSIGVEAHDLIQSITFGTVLITLLMQGLTLSRFLRLLGLGELGRRDRELQELQMRLLAARSAIRELDRLQDAGLITSMNYRHLRSKYQLGITQAEQGLQEMQVNQQLEESAKRLMATQRHLLTVEKSALLDAVRDKIVADEAAAPLLQRLDEQLLALSRYLDER